MDKESLGDPVWKVKYSAYLQSGTSYRFQIISKVYDHHKNALAFSSRVFYGHFPYGVQGSRVTHPCNSLSKLVHSVW